MDFESELAQVWNRVGQYYSDSERGNLPAIFAWRPPFFGNHSVTFDEFSYKMGVKGSFIPSAEDGKLDSIIF